MSDSVLTTRPEDDIALLDAKVVEASPEVAPDTFDIIPTAQDVDPLLDSDDQLDDLFSQPLFSDHEAPVKPEKSAKLPMVSPDKVGIFPSEPEEQSPMLCPNYMTLETQPELLLTDCQVGLWVFVLYFNSILLLFFFFHNFSQLSPPPPRANIISFVLQ